MAGRTVVMVLDRDDPSHGDIKMLADGNEAARLAEDLLESGVEVERIRVFDAVELSLKVAHRPVVSLGTDSGEEFAAEPLESLDELATLPSWSTEPQGEVDAEGEGDLDGEVVTAEPHVRNGVRFSSLFKSDEINGG
ncbi:MAG TPA: hypothetical protein VGB13_08815 [Candidatus Krumholzibacteria bacterium]